MTTTTRTFTATADEDLAAGIDHQKAQIATDSPKAAAIRTGVIAKAEAEQNRRKRA
jgi:hypothetical protein